MPGAAVLGWIGREGGMSLGRTTRGFREQSEGGRPAHRRPGHWPGAPLFTELKNSPERPVADFQNSPERTAADFQNPPERPDRMPRNGEALWARLRKLGGAGRAEARLRRVGTSVLVHALWYFSDPL